MLVIRMIAGSMVIAACLLFGGQANSQDSDTQRDFIAVVSPDQTRLAYYSYRAGASPDIFLMDLSNGTEVNLTNTDDLWEIEPTWSPDGKYLAFAIGTSMRSLQIFALDMVDRNLAQYTDDEGANSRPVYSPDGRYLFYHQRIDDEHAYINRIDLESGDRVRLTDGQLLSTSPFVSPDGRTIAYIGTNPASRKADIYLMNIDGSSRRRVVDSEIDERSARFTPDGNHLLVAMQPDNENTGLFLINLEDLHFRRLSTTDDAHSYSANFSPDGKFVYYDIGTWDGDFFIYRSNFDYDPLRPVRVTGGDSAGVFPN